jgi:hypothetical protein
MTTPETVNGRATKRRHNDNGSAGPASATCPFCGAPVTTAEFREIRARIEAEEKARVAKLETALKAQLAAAQQQATAKAQAEITKARQDATAQIATAKREAAAREAAVRKQATEAVTAALAPQIAEAVNAEKQRAFAEKLRLQEQLQDLQRRLEKRTANELGEEGELDVLDMLSKAFPDDEIVRVARGKNGGDIIHKIVHGGAGGAVTGKLLYEAKNHKQYQHKWTAKARQDQIAEQADHCVIVTAAFPAGHRELMVKDGVLVVSPARLIAIATWLRAQTIRSHSLKLSQQERSSKSERLYSFMVSDRVADRWDRMAQTMARMRDSLRAERSAHDRVWADRTDQLDVLTAIRNDLDLPRFSGEALAHSAAMFSN